MTNDELKTWREGLKPGDEVAIFSSPNYGRDNSYRVRTVYRVTKTLVIVTVPNATNTGFRDRKFRVVDGEESGHADKWLNADEIIPVPVAKHRRQEQEDAKPPERKRADRKAAIERLLPGCTLETLDAVLLVIRAAKKETEG